MSEAKSEQPSTATEAFHAEFAQTFATTVLPRHPRLPEISIVWMPRMTDWSKIKTQLPQKTAADPDDDDARVINLLRDAFERFRA